MNVRKLNTISTPASSIAGSNASQKIYTGKDLKRAASAEFKKWGINPNTKSGQMLVTLAMITFVKTAENA